MSLQGDAPDGRQLGLGLLEAPVVTVWGLASHCDEKDEKTVHGKE
jgi:hypothetical protein